MTMARRILVCFSAMLLCMPLATLPAHAQFGYGTTTYEGVPATGTRPLLILMVEMILVRRAAGLHPYRVIAVGTLLTGLGLGALPWGSGFFFVALTVAIWTLGEMLTFPFLEGVVAQMGGPGTRGRGRRTGRQ